MQRNPSKSSYSIHVVQPRLFTYIFTPRNPQCNDYVEKIPAKDDMFMFREELYCSVSLIIVKRVVIAEPTHCLTIQYLSKVWV